LAPQHYIFNHIPKTGGTSFLAICRDNLDPAEISPHLDDTEIRRLQPARFERYRLIRGHISVLVQAGFCRSRYSMTLLREPIRRIFSAYTFWRTSPESNPVTAKAKEVSFTDFVQYFIDSPTIIQNPYTHHLAAVSRDCPAYPADEAALLAAARRNLAAFDFVGVCEELGRSVRLLCAELGWRLPDAVPHQNRTASEERFAGIDRKTMEILRERNRLDAELYEYAIEILHAREAALGTSAAAWPEAVEPNRFVPVQLPCQPQRRATVRSVSATWDAKESSRRLEIAVDFRTRAPIAELSLGIQVNDAIGNIVWGTSTSRECLELEYETGRDCRAALVVECDLPPGMYFVTVSLDEPRRLGFHEHWIDHAALFTVTPPRAARSPYVRGIRSQEFLSTVARNVNGQ